MQARSFSEVRGSNRSEGAQNESIRAETQGKISVPQLRKTYVYVAARVSRRETAMGLQNGYWCGRQSLLLLDREPDEQNTDDAS